MMIEELSELREKESDECIHWIAAVAANVSQLDVGTSQVIELIARINLWQCEASIRESIEDFLLSLVSVNNVFLRRALEWIFTAVKRCDLCALPEDETLSMAYWTAGLAHSFLELIPSATKLVIDVLAAQFPHKVTALIVHQAYGKLCFHLCSLSPELRGQILRLVLEKMVVIDVEIKAEEDLEMKQRTPGGSHDSDSDDDLMFNVDVDSKLQAMALKMDDLMLQTLTYLQEQLAAGQSEDLFNAAFLCFERTILSTYQSRYVQFILFYLTSHNSFWTEHFLQRLTESLCQRQTGRDRQKVLAGYIGSFVSRSRFVEVGTVRRALSSLCQFAMNFIAQQNAERLLAPLGSDSVFFVVLQTILYILCFKTEVIATSTDGLVFLRSLPLQDLLAPQWQSRRYILPSILDEFQRQSDLYHLMEVVENDSAQVVVLSPSTSSANLQKPPPSTSKQGQENDDNPEEDLDETLDSFFPFDPYPLRKSSTFIHPLYQDWKDGDDQSDDQSDDLSGSEEEADEEDLEAVDSNEDSRPASDSSLPQSSSLSRKNGAGLLGAHLAKLKKSRDEAFSISPSSGPFAPLLKKVKN